MQTLDRSTTIDDVLDAREWRSLAACRDTDPDIFFPVGTTGVALDQIARAKKICHKCDVRKQCLEYALVNNQESGIWGGTSEDERRQIRKSWLTRQRRSA